jgi:hypothetical protein
VMAKHLKLSHKKSHFDKTEKDYVLMAKELYESI